MMKSVKSVWLLGAADPEMSAIEELLSGADETVAHAAIAERRVYPGAAYKAEEALHCGMPLDVSAFRLVYAVECGGPVLSNAVEVVRIVRMDHHNPGDPGFGKPPVEFFPASSVGQVVAELAKLGGLPKHWGMSSGEVRKLGSIWRDGGVWIVTDALGNRIVPMSVMLTAAADHCLGAAYAGQCPGVDPVELATHRLNERANWLSRGPGQGRDAPRADVAKAANATIEALDSAGVSGWRLAIDIAMDETAGKLQAAPKAQLGGVKVADLRGVGTLPELPEVCARQGVAAVYRMLPPPKARDPRVKIGILGGGMGTVPGTDPVEAFLRYAREAGEVLGVKVDGAYGDPVRGYAGAYEVES